MATPKKYATVPIYSDSSGREVVPGNAVSVGTFDILEECNDRKRRLDERERKLSIRECELNIEKRRLDARTDSLAERENALDRKVRISDAIRKMKRLHARLDELEAQEEEERAIISAAEFALPPGIDIDGDEETSGGSASDEGEQTTGELTVLPPSAPEDEEQLEAIEEDAAEPGSGSVPMSYGKLPTSYVKSEGEGDLPTSLTEKTPPITGTEPEFPEAREPTARNPVGVSW